MKKIIFILHLPPPVHGSSMVGKYIKDSKIINSSFNAQFINLSTSRKIDEIGKNPIIKISRYLKILYTLIFSLAKFNPDFVYLAVTAKGLAFYKDFPTALLVKLFGKKLVLHFHNKGVDKSRQNLFHDWFYRILFKKSKVILLSEILYNDVIKYVKKQDVFFCPNGIPVEKNTCKILPKNSQVPGLLFLSNLIESKGVFLLLEALKILKDKGIIFHCNFVGGEADISSTQLNQKIDDLDLQEYVTYMGKKYGKDKFKILSSSDIFIFPTFYHNECFPLVILEAMQFGLPVISTGEGGIPDIIKDRETGFIINKKNPIYLAEKIKYLIENPNDSIIMGKKGKDLFFKHYTLEIFEKRITYILNQIK